MNVDRFQKSTGGTYKCHRCGKRTRETGKGESAYELCVKCLEVAEQEEK